MKFVSWVVNWSQGILCVSSPWNRHIKKFVYLLSAASVLHISITRIHSSNIRCMNNAEQSPYALFVILLHFSIIDTMCRFRSRSAAILMKYHTVTYKSICNYQQVLENRSRDSVIGIATRLRTGLSRVLIQAGFTLLQNVQNVSEPTYSSI